MGKFTGVQLGGTKNIDGMWVNSRVASIVQVLVDFDPAISCKFIPEDERVSKDAPAYKIVETRNGMEYDMFYVHDEAHFDESVIERVFRMDAAKHGDILNEIDAHNAAIRAKQASDYMSRVEEQLEFARSVGRHSSKHAYVHDGRRWDLPGAPAVEKSKTFSLGK